MKILWLCHSLTLLSLSFRLWAENNGTQPRLEWRMKNHTYPINTRVGFLTGIGIFMYVY